MAIIATMCALVVLAGASQLATFPFAAVLFLWFAFVHPRAATACGAILGVLIRPALDLFGSFTIAEASPASLFGALMLAWGVTVYLARLRSGLRRWPSRIFAVPQLLLIALNLSAFLGGLLLSHAGIVEVETRELVRFASTLAGGLLAVWWQDDSYADGWRPAVVLLIAASAVPLGAGAIQAMTGTGNHEDGDLNRVFGSFTHPLSCGSYLLPLVVVGFAACHRMRGIVRGIALVYTLIAGTLLFLTYNRTTLLLLIIALSLYVSLQLGRVRRRDVVRLVGLSLALGCLAWLVFGAQIVERFSGVSITASAVQEALVSGSQNSFQWRIVNWAVLIQLGFAHPIVGHGLGMTTVLNPLIQASSGVPFNAHNDYVRFFFEGGLLGLGLYTGFAITFARWLWRARRGLRAADQSIAHAAIGSLAALFLFSAGTTEMSLQSAVLYPAYLLLGILVGAETRRDRWGEDVVPVHQVQNSR